jgi:hypothetical protein
MRSRLLIGGAAAACGVLALLWLGRDGLPKIPLAASPNAGPALESGHNVKGVAPELVPPAAERKDATPQTGSPTEVGVEPSAPDTSRDTKPDALPDLGGPDQWAVEYSRKDTSVLVEDEARLRQEAKADLDAEIERRFRDGRVTTYRSGTQPIDGVTNGVRVGRNDGVWMRYVDIDPLREPDLFAKELKASWLRAEIAARGRR